MTHKFRFNRTAAGAPDLTDADVEISERVTAELRGDLAVSREIRVAAENRLVAMARDLAFNANRPLVDAIEHVAATNLALLRLSRARIVDDELADVVAAGAQP
jgi:hypothetical protein